MEQSFLVSVQLTEQRTDLHVDFALILQFFELAGWGALEPWQQVLTVDLVQTRVQAKSALFQSAHFLEAERHIVHSDLN